MLSYITAWLKYHYPLNWWAAVLTHSSEDEINSYWTDIYQYVGSPSVTDLSDKYVIKNGKLIPPISCIKGVGDAVIAEINSKGPYTSLENFFEKTSRRIINVGVVQKLVITGALDSLLGREFHSPEAKLRYVFALLKKNDKDNLPEKFQNLNPFEWYLELKRTLPSSAASLYQAIKKTSEVKMPFITKDLGENVFGSALRGKYVLVNGKGLQSLINEMSGMGKSYVEVCAYGYVKSLRRFSYKGNTRSAIEVIIDFDHLPIKLCIWPGWEDKEPECNSYLTDKEAYLFTLKISSVEGKEVQVTKVNKILIEKANKL
jgi:DNA polymerase III alpha subunit